MIWAMRGETHTSVEEAVLSLSGQTSQELKNPKACPPETIIGLTEAADAIMVAKKAMRPVIVIGDYDADGITSVAIISKLLSALGMEHTTVIPRRLSDGYGVSEKHLSDVRDSLLITVDNGIHAGALLDKCTESGNTVIVIDHHLPGDNIPASAILVDPHVEPDKNGFVDYCGAGLSYKLATYILKDLGVHDKLRNDLLVLAGIGTIGDSMPLVGDNRIIVRKMLELVNTFFAPLSWGLRQLLWMCGEQGSITSETIAFKVAPLINAPGRLYDAGGSSSLKMLLCDDEEESRGYAARMDAINKKRRFLVDSHMPAVCSIVKDQSPPVVVYIPSLPEGILGIVAGRLLEMYGTAAIVLTDSADADRVKGSVRASGVHATNMVASAKNLVLSYGGHEGAAGLFIRKEHIQEFTEAVRAYCAGACVDSRLYYDVTLEPSSVATSMRELRALAPLGQGVPAPVCKVSPVLVREVVYMGAERKHVKLISDGFAVVGFDKADLYRKYGEPSTVEVVGTISENHFRGRTTIQVVADDFRPCIF